MEDISLVAQNPGKVFDSTFKPLLWRLAQSGRSFVEVANDLINQHLGRAASGGSVIEPDSVLDESGRLYQGYKEGKYFLPNDGAEQDRLDLQYEAWRVLFSGWLGLAPFSSVPKYVLDIGAGTGLWAQEFAEQNPSSYVIGADLSAIQPIPKVQNCSFVKADMEEDTWIFPDPNLNHGECVDDKDAHEHLIVFDYVHLRLMFTCFNDPKVVMARALENLKPGGWIEFQETSFNFYQANDKYKGDACIRWGKACIKGAAASGRNIDLLQYYKQWLEEVGFVEVVERKFFAPAGGWHADPRLKLTGQYSRENTLMAIKSVHKMVQAGGLSTEEVDQLSQEVTTELSHKDNHTYWFAHIIYGRKPLDSEI
ncbi:S-adenosyl-L-methionine-dependent methyltransferase [Xylariales sp. PMI_506]|nr:S-adenosyl-L-methionine-dependent methyltransferase [Xylariales sp. PMI_506]